jgi:hypothetical protein
LGRQPRPLEHGRKVLRTIRGDANAYAKCNSEHDGYAYCDTRCYRHANRDTYGYAHSYTYSNG